jgi:hypothetical protein
MLLSSLARSSSILSYWNLKILGNKRGSHFVKPLYLNPLFINEVKMSKRILILALLLIAGLTTAAYAEGGFYGTVTFDDCSCYQSGTNGDYAIVQSTGGGPQYIYYLRCGGNPGYTTEGGNPATFPPGYYNIWVGLHTGTDCTLGYVQTVYHGSANQEVNLFVEKTPPPDSK